MTQKSVSVTKAAGIIGLFTLVSRIFGLIRDVVLAAFIPKRYTDVFFVAFTIPNTLRRLLAEGALTIAFIPVFTDYRKKGSDEAEDFVTAAFSVTALVVLVVSIVGIALAWPLAMVFAGGYSKDPLKFNLVVNLIRIMFPYILFVSLMALSMGVLNTVGHFFAPAAAPVLLNISLIIGAVSAPFIGSYVGVEPIYVLAWFVLLGGVLQFLVQIPPMAKRGFPLRVNLNFKHPGVKKVMKLMAPALLGLAVYQVMVMGSRLFASFLGSGAVSYLYYSQRLIEFPMGVFAVAIATGAMPKMAEHASDGELEKLKSTLRFSIELAMFVVIPSMVGLIIIAKPVVAMFFQRGLFDWSMTVETSKALIAFSLGLPAMATARNVVPAFYALKDSKTPVIASTFSLVAFLVLSPLLMWPFGHTGLALSITIAAWVNVIVLLYKLRKRVGLLGLKSSLIKVIKMVLGALVMGCSAWGVTYFGNWPKGSHSLTNILLILVAIFISGVVYALGTTLLGLTYFNDLLSKFRVKFKGKS
jgi:putative peptidoglycan lipid II flippase